jgi:pyruvate kinase
MINNQIPTRAETTDVANAVWDGTDVVMLSGETSVGRYPVETVEMMHKILSETEFHMGYLKTHRFKIPATIEENLFSSVGKAITDMAKQINASAIATITQKGRMVVSLSKFRPSVPIAALTNNFEIMNILRLVWGVKPLYFEDIKDETAAIRKGTKILRENGIVKTGDTVIFTSGAPEDEKGSDIWIRFAKV